MNKQSTLTILKEVLELEAKAIDLAADSLSEAYADVVAAVLACAGKVVITGLGKSGIVGRKIAATMTSTGTPAVFLHAAEALHGDLGIVAPEDIVFAISKSGEQGELNAMMPALRRIGANVVALTANANSSLAQAADWVLCMPVDREACPHDLAPTVSSTVTLALGDALAMAIMRARGFKSEDFALYHPGGKLGKRLLLRVSDVMVPIKACPLVNPSSEFADVLATLTRYGIGMVMFGQVDHLSGIVTDGDIRRLIAKERENIFTMDGERIMVKKPLLIRQDVRAIEALEAMEKRVSPISVAPVVDAHGKVVGAVRLHDLLQAG